MAMLYSQFPPPDPAGSSGSSGNPTDPNTLYIFIGNHSFACSDPFKSNCGDWDASIALPPPMQKPGVIPFSALDATFSYQDPPDPNGDCFGAGAGSFVNGMLEIVSIDAMFVVGKLEGTWTFTGVDTDGSFTAPRCP